MPAITFDPPCLTYSGRVMTSDQITIEWGSSKASYLAWLNSREHSGNFYAVLLTENHFHLSCTHYLMKYLYMKPPKAVVPILFSLKPSLPVSKTSQAPQTHIHIKNKVINYKLLFAKINISCRFLLIFSLFYKSIRFISSFLCH